MKYRAIATDYDGTLATDGTVDTEIRQSLKRYREAGGHLLLVTGRELSELKEVFNDLALFDGVIAENGAVFWQPGDEQVQLLAKPLPDEFVSSLIAQNVSPISQGQVLVATWQPHFDVVEQTITKMGLEAEIILNKRAIMILPKGVNKKTGLEVGLTQLQLSPEQVAGIGDAENDRDLLLYCGLGVAVENALPDLKAIADWETKAPRGQGVQELIEWCLGC
ncbi:HAD family hydrolase [Cyanothece sp. BG0011]|uniref:HAD family hydrolase n=1 Tax=Cyanothece sp. BG0011 TaxID=2082950 RepID=UPI000D1DEADA|nr:HAD family hydrolase [Cyanothece sp. BG0011]